MHQLEPEATHLRFPPLNMFAYSDGCVSFTHVHVLHNALKPKFNLLDNIAGADLNISSLPPDNETGSRRQRPPSQSTLIAFDCSSYVQGSGFQSSHGKVKTKYLLSAPELAPTSWATIELFSAFLLHIFRGFECFPIKTSHTCLLCMVFSANDGQLQFSHQPHTECLDFNKYSF